MSVIAWDGTTVAADRQATEENTRTSCKKIIRIRSSEILCDVGDYSIGLALIDWYKKGRDPAKFPRIPKDNGTKLIVFSAAGVIEYETSHHGVPVKEPFFAWGIGKDLAIGAMAMGADARQAVKVACKYNVLCGMGVTALTVRR